MAKAKKPPHKAKSTTKWKEVQAAKNDRPNSKYNLYRFRRGLPNGPGEPGNKSGKNKRPRS